MGLTARDFDIIVTGTTIIETTQDVHKPCAAVPGIYTPGDFLLIDDHSFYDYQVGINYDLVDSFSVDFNLNLGYQAVKMEFEDLNNLYTDLEFKGAFVGMIAHF